MYSILLVEDDNDLREILHDNLVQLGHRVTDAVDGLKAIEEFENDENIDLVVSDIIMPNFDGMEFLTFVKNIKPNIKVIMMSGGGRSGGPNYLANARSFGCDETLSKPFSISDLKEKIDIVFKE